VFRYNSLNEFGDSVTGFNAQTMIFEFADDVFADFSFFGILQQSSLFEGGGVGGADDHFGYYQDGADDTYRLWYDADGFNAGSALARAVINFGAEDIGLDISNIFSTNRGQIEPPLDDFGFGWPDSEPPVSDGDFEFPDDPIEGDSDFVDEPFPIPDIVT
jgi:hypothetical protein